MTLSLKRVFRLASIEIRQFIAMDLARAFTKRSKRSEVSVFPPTRAATVKYPGPIQRKAISPPIELLSTTNVLALNAPDLYSSPLSASSLSDDSDSSIGALQSSRGTTPDSSSVDLSPSSIEPNHLTAYFQSPGGVLPSVGLPNDANAPIIPSRAHSHTKKSHQALARQRSISRSAQSPPAIHSAKITRDSIDMFSNKLDINHPFGAELAQVNELAEEIGANNVLILDEEEDFLISQGLLKFGVEEYLDEIQGLFGGSFGNPFGSSNAGWI